MNRSNVILIGMPGAGKSTVGVLLAKRLGLGFLDTDLLIQTRTGETLQTTVDRDGAHALRAAEEQVLQGLDVSDHVIATGGSAVFSESGMAALRRSGTLVFLDVPFDEIRRRVSDADTRGIAKAPHQSLRDVFDEREPLYRRHAAITIDCTALGQEQVVEAVVGALRNGTEREA